MISTKEGEHEPCVGDVSGFQLAMPQGQLGQTRHWPPVRTFCEIKREEDVSLINADV